MRLKRQKVAADDMSQSRNSPRELFTSATATVCAQMLPETHCGQVESQTCTDHFPWVAQHGECHYDMRCHSVVACQGWS